MATRQSQLRRRSISEAAADLFHTSASLDSKIRGATQSKAPAAISHRRVSKRFTATSIYKLEDDQANRLRSLLSRLVLLPSSPFLVYWDVIVFFGLTATGALYPCALVFDQLNGSVISMVTGLALSSLFMFDTFLHFFRAYRVSTREGVVLVTYLPDLCHMYLHGLFVVDALSACPFVLLTLIDRNSRPLLIVRICMPMLRFVRLPRLMMHLQSVTRWSFRIINIVEFALVSFFVLHWIACSWAALGSWDDAKVSWLTAAKNQYRFLDEGDYSDARLYLISLYWSVTVLTSVGFGDITPQNWSEFVCATICMSIGGGVWAFVVGSVCGMATALDKHKNNFENQMNDVTVICKERKLPGHLQERVREFYKHSQDFMRMKMYHDTIHDLSPALKGEVISWMYGSCFRRVWYFDVLDDKCARVLAERMVPEMYAPEEFIEVSVDNARALVFLRSGLCVRKLNLLAPGAVWGLDVILGSEEHEDIEELLDTVLARSINYVFVLKLSKHSIDHAASLSQVFARRLRRAHCRMLLWRGLIAAARAEKRIQECKEHPETQSHMSHWDRLGKLMGQVVHRDRILLEDQKNPSPLSPVGAMHKRNSIHLMGAMHKSGSRRSPSLSKLNIAGLVERVNPSKPASLAGSSMSRQTSEGRQTAPVRPLSRQSSPGPRLSRYASEAKDEDGDADNNEDWRLPTDRGSIPTPSSSGLTPDLPHRRKRSADRTRVGRKESWRTSPSDNCMRDHLDVQSSLESRDSSVGTLLSNWKKDIKNGMDLQARKLQNLRSEVQADVETVREEVQQLHRLMHQLLAKLDAEEKY